MRRIEGWMIIQDGVGIQVISIGKRKIKERKKEKIIADNYSRLKIKKRCGCTSHCLNYLYLQHVQYLPTKALCRSARELAILFTRLFHLSNSWSNTI